MGHSKYGKQAVGAAVLTVEALELRLKGMSYKQIGEELDCAIGTAYNAVSRGLKELNSLAKEKAEEVRQLELSRIDSVLDSVIKRAKKGNDKAIASMVKLMDRRAKYLGLDSPVQTEDIAERERVILQLAERLNISAEDAREEYEKTKSGYSESE